MQSPGAVTDSFDSDKWVSLGQFDISSPGLEEPGKPWHEIIPTDVTNGIPPSLMPELPVDDWREVQLRDSRADERLFASPSALGWFAVHLSTGGVLSAHAEPARLRPGQEARRRGLHLQVNVGAANFLEGLSARLTNASGTPWTADSDDSGFVHGHLSRDGAPRSSGWFAYAPLDHEIRDLEPGETLDLPIHFPVLATSLPSGDYEVTATLVSLGLTSTPVSVAIITNASPETPIGPDRGPEAT